MDFGLIKFLDFILENLYVKVIDICVLWICLMFVFGLKGIYENVLGWL